MYRVRNREVHNIGLILLSFFLFGFGTTSFSTYEATECEQKMITAFRAMRALQERLPEGESQSNSVLSQEAVQKYLSGSIQSNAQAVIRELVSNFNAQLNEPDRAGITPLCLAATARTPQLAIFLVSLGADPNLQAPNGLTPLACAIHNRRIATVKFFLKRGVDVEAGTPLSIAIFKNYADIVECLLRSGANPNAIRQGCSQLQIACIYGHPKIVEILIGAGAHVNLNGDGASPLHLAAENGHVRVMELLLRHGANIEAHAHKRKTPLDLAIDHTQPEAAALLIERGAKFKIHKIKKLAKLGCLGHTLCSLMPYIFSLTKLHQEKWINIVNRLADESSDNFEQWSKSAEGHMCRTLYQLLSPFMRHEPAPYLAQIYTLLGPKVPRVLAKELFELIGLPWREIDKPVPTRDSGTQVNFGTPGDQQCLAKRNPELNKGVKVLLSEHLPQDIAQELFGFLGLSGNTNEEEQHQSKMDESGDIEMDNSSNSSPTGRSHAGKRSRNEQDRRLDNHTESSDYDNKKRAPKRQKQK